MSAPIRDLRAEARQRLAELSTDAVSLVELWEWLDSLPAARWLAVCHLLGVRADEGELVK